MFIVSVAVDMQVGRCWGFVVGGGGGGGVAWQTIHQKVQKCVCIGIRKDFVGSIWGPSYINL